MKANSSSEIANLETERRNPDSRDLDTRSALEIATIMNAEDAKVAGAVKKALPQIARAVDAIAYALSRGGRVIYVGTGSSGRLAALDASECPPTFNTDPRKVQFVIAGGVRALAGAVEADEDSQEGGRADMARRKPGKGDVVVGIAASGRTPYTVAALRYARERGATTVAIVGNRHTALEREADIPIVVVVGPEVVAGSTRLKAGTAHKMVLNMLSTGAMARLGYVYGNLMVNLHRKNSKLADRGLRIVALATGMDADESTKALRRAGGSVPVAIIMATRSVTRSEAERRLRENQGHLRKALDWE